MRHARKYTYDRNRAPVETPEPAPVTCECPSINVGDTYKAKLLQIHTRACAGIVDLSAVPELSPCDVCGGPAPCASCALWACPPVGTAIVYTTRPLDARPVKVYKGTVTRIDAADADWPAGVVVVYPKIKYKGAPASVFHGWPHAYAQAVAS